MNEELKKHEVDLLTLLRLYEPHDEVRIVVHQTGWTVFAQKNERVEIEFEGVAKKE